MVAGPGILGYNPPVCRLSDGGLANQGTSASRLAGPRTESWLVTKKKGPPYGEPFFLVAQVHSNWNLILTELSRWLQLNSEVKGLVYSTAGD